MNKMYAQRNGIPVDNEKQSTAMKVTNELIRKQQESRERSEQILNYYRNGQQKDVRI